MFRLTSTVSRTLYGLRTQAIKPFAVTTNSILAASTQLVSPVRSFKTKSAVKKMCPDCYLVRRKGRVFVYCKSNGKHKQRQG